MATERRSSARSRAEGYAIDAGEYLEDVRCVAAPIRDAGGLVIGSIGVSAPATRMSGGRDFALAQHVRDTAEHINALLGA